MTAIEPGYGYPEAAEKLTTLGYPVTEEWLRRHFEVPRIKVGRRVVFTDSLLAEFLAANTKRATERTDPHRPISRRR